MKYAPNHFSDWMAVRRLELARNADRRDKRQRTERRIVRQFVVEALSAGHSLSVSLENGYDTEDMLLSSKKIKDIMDEAFGGDECHIFVHEGIDDPKDAIIGGQLNSIGWVHLVFGNDGWDVIANYTTNLEELLAPANKLAESLED
jgi:hypothetical protein